MVEIREVKTRKELKKFAGFNEKMYRDIPQAIPDLISDEMDNFTPKKNPAYEYAESRQWLAYKDGQCVGRIGAIISHKANKKWNRKRIRFTRVDFIDDYEVSKALFQTVENWGKERGMEAVHGPMGFCDLDQEGMLIEGFDYKGMFISIHNAPYYKEHLERLGYIKSVDWIENRITIPEEVPEFFTRLSARIQEEQKLRIFKARNRRELKKYIPEIFDVVNDTYRRLYGEVELTQKQIDKYVKQFLLLVNCKYAMMVMNEENQMIGFGLAVPSLADASKKSHGRLFPLGWIRVLYAPYSKTDTLELFLIGVRDAYKNTGVPAMLIEEGIKTAIADGKKYAETGPMLEDNLKIHSLWKRIEKVQHKRRRCWIKEL